MVLSVLFGFALGTRLLFLVSSVRAQVSQATGISERWFP